MAASLTIAEHLLPGWLVAVRADQVRAGHEPTEFTMTATNSERVVGLVSSGEVELGFPLVVRESGSGTRTVLERAQADLPVAAPTLELSSTAGGARRRRRRTVRNHRPGRRGSWSGGQCGATGEPEPPVAPTLIGPG